jgi:hypothetical protein
VDAIQRAVRGVIMERAVACRVTDLDEAEIVLMLSIIAPINNGLWSRGVYTSTSKEQMRARIDVYEGDLGSVYIRSVAAVLYQILQFDLRSKYETREVSGGLVWEGGSVDLNTRQPYFTGDMVLTPVDHAGRQRALETWSRRVHEIERYNTLTQAAQANAQADADRRRLGVYGALQQQQQQQQALAAQQGMPH